MNEVSLFKALGEESRFLIVRVLLEGEMCACEIPERIGRSQSNTSMHLSKLAEAGVVSSRREGRKIIYSIADERIVRMLEVMALR